MVSKITTFIRRATWITLLAGLEQHLYSEQEREEFKMKLEAHLQYRKTKEELMNSSFPISEQTQSYGCSYALSRTHI
jgi:hypothetical protein